MLKHGVLHQGAESFYPHQQFCYHYYNAHHCIVAFGGFFEGKNYFTQNNGNYFWVLGALTLVLYEFIHQKCPNIPLGNAMMLINAFSYGAYLVIIKPITGKYHVITLMKWMFPLGVLMNLPLLYRTWL